MIKKVFEKDVFYFDWLVNYKKSNDVRDIFLYGFSYDMTIPQVEEVLKRPMNQEDLPGARAVMESLVSHPVKAPPLAQPQNFNIPLELTFCSPKIPVKRSKSNPQTNKFHLHVDSESLLPFLQMQNGEVVYSCPFNHLKVPCSSKFKPQEQLKFGHHLIGHLPVKERKKILTCELCNGQFYSFQKISRGQRVASFRAHLVRDHES